METTRGLCALVQRLIQARFNRHELARHICDNPIDGHVHELVKGDTFI